MRRSSTNEAVAAAYAELEPCAAHRHLVDHLFVLRDSGQLTGPGRSIYASPFCETALLGQTRGSDIAWQALQTQPRFHHQPRPSPLNGWMIGFRFDPLKAGDAAWTSALDDLAIDLDRIVRHHDGFDAIVARLDRALDALVAASPQALRSRDRALVVVHADPTISVARLADAAEVTPRTLQRLVRARTGLPPKRYTALRRFNAALHDLADGEERFADVAVASGYADQAHMTADIARHTGSSPGRLRAFARRQDRDEAVRFFKDAAVLKRIRLFIHEPLMDGDIADGGVHADQPS